MHRTGCSSCPSRRSPVSPSTRSRNGCSVPIATGSTARSTRSTALSTTTSPRSRTRRPTRQAEAVLQAVGDTTNFRSAQDIHAALRSAGREVGLTTVYRHLQALSDGGLVDAWQAERGETVYRRCATTDLHHHIVCRQCGRTTEVESPEVERWADRVASAAGYTDVSHTVEVFGVCGACTKKLRRAHRAAT